MRERARAHPSLNTQRCQLQAPRFLQCAAHCPPFAAAANDGDASAAATQSEAAPVLPPQLFISSTHQQGETQVLVALLRFASGAAGQRCHFGPSPTVCKRCGRAQASFPLSAAACWRCGRAKATVLFALLRSERDLAWQTLYFCLSAAVCDIRRRVAEGAARLDGRYVQRHGSGRLAEGKGQQRRLHHGQRVAGGLPLQPQAVERCLVGGVVEHLRAGGRVTDQQPVSPCA